MANRYYPYVGIVDPDKYPHLAEAAEQETANAIWDREMELHKAANPHLADVA